MNKKLLIPIMATFLVVVSAAPALAATEWVTTILYFNVASVDELTVTLLGEAAVTSDPGGQATTSNIEFNFSSGSVAYVEARRTNSADVQSDGNPILTLNNTGTSNLEINISTSAAAPGCMVLRYNDTAFCATPATCATELGATNITIDSNYTTTEALITLYLWANATDCSEVDTTSVTMYMYANTV